MTQKSQKEKQKMGYNDKKKERQMRGGKKIVLELKKDELEVLKEILENEVVSYSAFLKDGRQRKASEIEKYLLKLKEINNELGQQLKYAASV